MSTRQKRVLEQLVDVTWRDGRAHAIRTGFTLQCTECGHKYCSDGRNTWRQKAPEPLSLVDTFQRPAMEARERSSIPRPKEKPPI